MMVEREVHLDRNTGTHSSPSRALSTSRAFSSLKTPGDCTGHYLEASTCEWESKKTDIFWIPFHSKWRLVKGSPTSW